MNFELTVVSVLLISVFFLAENLYGQANMAENDSTFTVYMSEALEEISEQEGTPGADSLQNNYAADFFQYHLEHPSSKTGWRAGWMAFMLWWHTGSAEKMDVAMAKLGYDSELWSRIMGYIKAGYDRSEQKSKNEYLDLLHRLKEKLTHPVSRSAVLFHMGEYYMSEDRRIEAQALYRKVVNLDAHSSRPLPPLSSSFVEQALEVLNEMDS